MNILKYPPTIALLYMLCCMNAYGVLADPIVIQYESLDSCCRAACLTTKSCKSTTTYTCPENYTYINSTLECIANAVTLLQQEDSKGYYYASYPTGTGCEHTGTKTYWTVNTDTLISAECNCMVYD